MSLTKLEELQLLVAKQQIQIEEIIKLINELGKVVKEVIVKINNL